LINFVCATEHSQLVLYAKRVLGATDILCSYPAALLVWALSAEAITRLRGMALRPSSLMASEIVSPSRCSGVVFRAWRARGLLVGASDSRCSTP
jgi:hypothetical protein